MLFNPLALSVKDAGAIGDGVTDDGAAIQLAVDEANGRPVRFPAGTYLIGASLLAGEAAVTVTQDDTTLMLDDGATILFAGTAAGTAGVRVSANGFTIQGGKMKGTWDMVGQGTTAMVSGDGTSVLNFQSNNAQIYGFTVIGTEFTRAAGRGIFCKEDLANSTNYGGVTLRDVKFFENFVHMQMENYYLDGPVEDILLENVMMDVTATPGPTETGASFGGNSITTIGTFDGITLRDVKIGACGRMALEFWLDSGWVASGYKNENIIVDGCNIAPARYRSISILGTNIVLDKNVITNGPLNSTWMELAGADISLINNKVFGQGWAATETPSGSNTKDNYVAKGNVFHDIFDQGAFGAVNFNKCHNADISDNRAIYSNAVKASVPKHPVFEVINCDNLKSYGNRVQFNNPCNRDSAYLYAAIRDFDISKNHVNFVGVPDFLIWAPFSIGQLQSGRLAHNTVHADDAFTVNAPSGVGSALVGNGIIRYKWNGTSYDATTCHTDVIDTPPGTPVVGLPYALGDNPTGVWLGKQRNFATWDGSVWTFEVISNFFLHLDGNAVLDLSHIPPGGGTFMLSATGWFDVEVMNNNFSHNNKIQAAIGFGINFDGFAPTSSMVWGCHFTRNHDIVTYGPQILINNAVVE